METPGLTSAEYWESGSIDLRLNPSRTIEAGGLTGFLQREAGVSKSIVLATSGSTGHYKFVVLSKEALLDSARAVVAHCEMTKEDVSLAGLSGFHVGGLGIFARAYLTGGTVIDASERKWDRSGHWLVDLVKEHGVTQTSLTPTHLHDLVVNRMLAPGCLRSVLLGGGRMNPKLIARGRELGWPIRVSYGMTEASSQIATAKGEEVEWLPMLPCWQARVGEGGCLAISGSPLFSGYAEQVNGQWSFDRTPVEGGWYATGDRCELGDGKLRFRGRADDLVKISGELVSLGKVEAIASSLAQERGGDAAVICVPDARRENELCLLLEGLHGETDRFLRSLNDQLDSLEAVKRVQVVPALPRTPIGKIDRSALRAFVS